MKKTLFLLLFFCPFLLNAAEPFYTELFAGEKFSVKITNLCEEGNVGCDKIRYEGISKKTGSKIILDGKTLNSEISMSFQGYRFENNNYQYSLYPPQSGDELWRLEVKFEGNLMTQDKGVMTLVEQQDDEKTLIEQFDNNSLKISELKATQ